jgi:hypothetical protein
MCEQQLVAEDEGLVRDRETGSDLYSLRSQGCNEIEREKSIKDR